MRKGYFTPPVLIILAAIIFAVAILIALNTDLVKRLKKEPSPTPVSSPTLSPSPTTQQSSSTTDEMANWKTYKNALVGFSIKYPANAQLYEAIDSNGVGTVDIRISDDNLRISIAVKDVQAAQLLPSTFKSCSAKGEVSILVIDGIESKKCVRKSSDGSITLIIVDDFTRNGQVIYDIGLTPLQPRDNNLRAAEIFDQILSTFQFID